MGAANHNNVEWLYTALAIKERMRANFALFQADPWMGKRR